MGCTNEIGYRELHVRTRGSLVSIPFDECTLGYIVRNKYSVEDRSPKKYQHADCILPEGYLVHYAFFDPRLPTGTLPNKSNSTRKYLGIVNDMNYLLKLRPPCPHVDLIASREMGSPSTVIVFTVGEEQAEAVSEYWEKLSKDPGKFNFYMNNCSTSIAKGFEAGNILKRPMGIVTPERLFSTLYTLVQPKAPFGARVFTGALGFEPQQNNPNCYTLLIDTSYKGESCS